MSNEATIRTDGMTGDQGSSGALPASADVERALACLDVLQLTQRATLADVERAHRIQSTVWDPEAVGPDPERRAIASRKREAIEASYAWLRDRPHLLRTPDVPPPPPPAPPSVGMPAAMVIVLAGFLGLATLALAALR